MRLAGALLLACLPLAAWADAPVLSAHGYDAVRFGMPLARAERVLGQKARPGRGDAECAQVRFPRYPGALFMVERGIVTRADVDRSVPNALGIRSGTPVARVLRRYPAMTAQPHKYDDEGQYLVWSAAQGRKAIVFEASKGRIINFRGGLRPSVEYVEGCL